MDGRAIEGLLRPSAQPAIPGLFVERLGRRPYAADTLRNGVRMQSPGRAVRRRYIQANPPHLRAWLLFDIDREGGGLAWKDAGLPLPSWSCVNRIDTRAHLSYGVHVPVLLGDYEGLEKPIRYLAALERAMRVKLAADPGYGGLVTKNPLRGDLYRVLWGNCLYSLGELHEHVGDLRRYVPRPGAAAEGLGRNCETFAALRKHAYRDVRQWWGAPGGFVHFQAGLQTWAIDYTGNEHTPPLDSRETWHIARSVARWTWARFSPSGFRAWQRSAGSKGGKASGQARRAATAERDAWIVSRVLAGESMRAVASCVGLDERTIRRIVARVRGVRREAISDNSPQGADCGECV